MVLIHKIQLMLLIMKAFLQNFLLITTLNIFSYQFNEVMNYVDKRAPKLKYIFVDTPGQIEVFNWSASGTIITEAFCTTYPTVYIYVVDTTRSTNPVTFMSNMLYACSLLYKSRLPIVIVFTKIDIISHVYALEWMKNFESFEEALKANTSYMGNFTQSMGFLLEEFYNSFPCVGVSSVTGEGIDELFVAIRKAAMEYETGFKVEMERIKEEKQRKEKERQEENMERLRNDMGIVIDTSLNKETYPSSEEDDAIEVPYENLLKRDDPSSEEQES